LASNLIYIELDDNFLFLSKLDKQKNQFNLNKKSIVNLNNSEFKDGILYNLSTIYLQIKDFLKINNIKKTRAIICIPNLSQKKEFIQKSNILKVALCACKANLKIKKIIDCSLLTKDIQMDHKSFFYKKDLENRLDFFKTFNPPPTKNPHKWFLFSGITLFCLVITLYVIQSDNKPRLNLLLPQNANLSEKNKKLEEEIKILHSAKNENNKLKEKIEKIIKIKTHLNNPINILVAITKSIPENSWLNNITFDNSGNLPNGTKTSKEPKKLEIEGITTQEEEITGFLKELSKSPELINLKLLRIQKIKKAQIGKVQINQQKPHYNFKISGELKKA